MRYFKFVLPFSNTLKIVYLARYIKKYYLKRETLLKFYSIGVTVQNVYTKNTHYKSDTSRIVTKVLSLLTRQENSEISLGYIANLSD